MVTNTRHSGSAEPFAVLKTEELINGPEKMLKDTFSSPLRKKLKDGEIYYLLSRI